jgi:hypothetical protein
MAAQHAAATEERRSFLFMGRASPAHVSDGGEFAKRPIGVAEERTKYRRRPADHEL